MSTTPHRSTRKALVAASLAACLFFAKTSEAAFEYSAWFFSQEAAFYANTALQTESLLYPAEYQLKAQFANDGFYFADFAYQFQDDSWYLYSAQNHFYQYLYADYIGQLYSQQGFPQNTNSATYNSGYYGYLAFFYGFYAWAT